VLIVNPTDQTLYEYGQLIQKQASIEEKLRDTIGKPAVTLDGHRVILTANVEQADAARAVKENGGEGVGLFRTEYLFLNREDLPGEDEQYEAYRKVVSELQPDPVVIRTLDLGGDKFPDQQQEWKEMNPFLGWRSIRFCLQRPDVFRTQIRAILRASVEKNLRIMYPLVTSIDEVNQANALVEECKEQLRREQKPFNENIEIGVMIETPAAALVADSLAQKMKFFSIGTNDLIQYTLAVDRMNEKIAHLFEPTHPAVLRLIKWTIDAAHARNIPVSVCGETAGDPVMVPLLLGMGVDELSASPPLLPSVKFIIRRLKISDARELAEFALNCESSAEILARSQTLAAKLAPNLFGNSN
jgi:phosphotransferase system enzyme I (PtsI)